ncbi:MAG: glycosyltransferase, partial [Gaiella sp.]
DYQTWQGGRRDAALRRSRTVALRRAAHVFVPSAYLRTVALGWGLDAAHVTVLPNPAPPLPPLPPRRELRARLGVPDETVLLAFAGRLTSQKALPDLLQAMAAVGEVTLLLLGDGPDRPELERLTAALGLDDRVRFLGGGTRDDVLRLFAAADVAVLSSSWENFPHTVVEALAVGAPVVATAVGGVPEIVVDGENGLLVPARDVDALRAALERIARDPELRARLAERAAPSVAGLAEEVLLAEIENCLLRVVGA